MAQQPSSEVNYILLNKNRCFGIIETQVCTNRPGRKLFPSRCKEILALAIEVLLQTVIGMVVKEDRSNL